MNWAGIIDQERSKDYFKELVSFISEEREKLSIYPPTEDIWNAFKLCPYEDTRVVILGMDPYHGAGQAHGLAFSVKPGIVIPPSLQNIYKELKSDLGCEIPKHGNLVSWSKQGVLLLNTALTVREGVPGSHMNVWEPFTKSIIKTLNNKTEPVVFILWGVHARKRRYLITNEHHFVIESQHPSPLSAYKGFFGSKPFSKTNDFLVSKNIKPIDWSISI